MNYDSALQVVAEKTTDIKEDVSQSNKQRRYQVVDLYGIEYYRHLTTDSPAKFYLSISPDLNYLERFQFKIAIDPAEGSTPTDFRILIDDVDITAYLIEQQGGDWIEAPFDSPFPSNKLVGEDDPSDAYDILDVACMLNAEGNSDEANKLLRAEYKKVNITATGECDVTMIAYLKYSHVNR